VLIRAELASFWRMWLQSGTGIERHFLLYPNPWPKPAHLKRRWHGHPVFPTLLALGGEIELRCNWEVYALEFALAAGALLGQDVRASRVRSATGISPFERKYLERQQALYAVKLAADEVRAFRAAYSPTAGLAGTAC
jgi:tRNA G46 methylase TrmB